MRIRVGNGLIMLIFILLLGCGATEPVKNDTKLSEQKSEKIDKKPKPEIIVLPTYTEMDRRFMASAKSGDYQEIKKQLESGEVKVNIKDAEGWTALHEASVSGKSDIAKLLIQKTANVDEKDVDGWTPLLVAAANGQTEIVEYLLQNRADFKVKDKNGITPLHVAAVNGYNNIAALLIKYGADVNAEDKDDLNPLSMAFLVNRTDMATFLIEKGAKIKLHNPGKVAGIVKDALTGNPLSGALIKVFRKDKILIKIEKTGSDGHYGFDLSEGDYILEISFADYILAMVYIDVKYNETTTVTSLRQVANVWSDQGIATGMLLNAFNGQPVSNATLKIRSGINVTNGTVIAKTITDNNGYYQINLPGGNYTIEAIKSAYTSIYFPIVSVGKHRIDNQNASITPTINMGEIRIVLSWGEQPEDLDAHLLTPNIKGAPYHVYYNWRGERSFVPYVQLDVDDKTSYGPETLTIYRSHPGTYHYYVHNYGGSPAITASDAKVDIFSATGLVKSYNVPISGSGKYWNVFSYNGSTGEITTIDQISSVKPN
jgi:hypothetical protein